MRQKMSGVIAACALAVLFFEPSLAATAEGDAADSGSVEPPPPAIQEAPPEIIESPTGEAEIEPPAIGQDPAKNEPESLAGGLLKEGQFNTDDLFGLTVVSADGRDLGKVAGFIIDGQAGRIAKLVVAADKFLGLEVTEFAVDWPNVTLERGSDHVALKVTQEQVAEDSKDEKDGSARE